MKRIYISLLLLFTAAVQMFSQEAQNTKNSADQMLRSNGTVNPSTLGLEINIPLGGYQGRGITLPIGLNYSSKLWRFATEAVLVTPHGYTCGNGGGDLPCIGQLWTFAWPTFAEDSTSGWTSTISQPYIEYTSARFNCIGTPITPLAPTGPSICGPNNPPRYVRRLTIHLPDATYELTDGDGYVGGNPPPANDLAWNGTYRSVDGSGVRYEENNAPNGTLHRIYMPDGSFYDLSTETASKPVEGEWSTIIRRATRLTDANGNYITFHEPDLNDPNGSITDTPGRTFPVMVPRQAPTVPADPGWFDQEFLLPGMGAPYRFRWKRLASAFASGSYQLHYRGSRNMDISHAVFHGPALFEGGPMHDEEEGCGGYDALQTLWSPSGGGNAEDFIFNPAVLTEITLPNGAKYEFFYNAYGEIERINYPAGGHEEYVFQQIASLAQVAKPYEEVNRGVVQRQVFENGTVPSTWTYTAGSSKNRYRTTITPPDNTKIERFMHRGVPPLGCDEHEPDEFPSNAYGLWYGYDNVLSGRPYEERIFNSSNQIVQQTITKWDRAEGSVLMTLYPERRVQLNPRVSWTQTITYDGDAGVAAATRLEYHDGYGDPGSPLNVRYKKEYAYTPAVVSGSTIHFNETPLPDSEPTLIDPTANQTPVRVTETTFNTDTAYTVDRNMLRLPIEVKVMDGSSNVKAKSQTFYDGSSLLQDGSGYTISGWSDPGTNVRGLSTSTKSWFNVSNANDYVQTVVQYNRFGSPRKTWDGNGNLSQVEYDDRFSDNTNHYTYALPTKMISAVPGGNGSNSAFQTETTYEFATNLPVSTKDINDQVTTIAYDDPLRRPTLVTAPNGQQTITEYGTPVNGQYPASERYVKVRSQIDASSWKEGYTWFDGLMRNVKTQSVDDDGDVFVLTCYDIMGRVSKASNPFRNWSSQDCSTANGTNDIFWTTNTFDTAGRPWKVTTPDTAHVDTTYSIATGGSQVGTVVTVADQAGKLRRSITNALGQLIRVDEPTTGTDPLGPINSPNQPTYYTYNTNGQMVRVQQGSQNRYFMYDSLGRMVRLKQPEQEVNTALNTSGNPDNNSWSTGISYDNNGNVLTTTDAKGTTITSGYDALNRPQARTYSDGTPTVTSYYDGMGLPSVPNYSKGKLTNVSNSFSVTKYSGFDQMGRLLESKQETNGQTYLSSYQYNLAGALTQETYPSGKIVNSEYDGNGELSRITGKANTTATPHPYATAFDYFPDGKIEKLKLGNNLWETATLNSRLQVTGLSLGYSEGNGDLFHLTYEYGELQTNGTVDGTKNAGNIAKQTVNFHGLANPLVQTYKYDPLDRINEAIEKVNGVQTWKQTFGYDVYGNRISRYQIIGNQELPINNITLPNIDATMNRYAGNQGYTFDKNGNITADPANNGRTFVFDGDNKQTEVRNSQNVVIGRYYYDGNGKRVKKVTDAETTIFVYDGLAKLIAEYSTATPPEVPKINYTATDQIGSPRVITDTFGTVESRRDFMPFGEELFADGTYRKESDDYSLTGQDAVRQRFTGYQRDIETNLDFAEARYYHNPHGRFTAVDPLLSSGQSANPQTFNRYAYAINRPLLLVDPTGLQAGTTRLAPCESGPTCGDYTQSPEQKKTGFVTATRPLGSVEVRADPEPLATETLSLGCPSGADCGSNSAPAPRLDTSSGPPLKSVEGIARISEVGSLIPGLNIPFSVIAATVRAGQGNAGSAGVNLLGVAPGFSMLRKADRVAETLTVIERARELGLAGERAAGVAGPKTAISIAGNVRVPDMLTSSTLTEVKNVAKLSFTSQLRDFTNYSRERGLDFNLVTRTNTRLSGPLQNAVNQGWIIHKPILRF